jgi:hypothetical protein
MSTRGICSITLLESTIGQWCFGTVLYCTVVNHVGNHVEISPYRSLGKSRRSSSSVVMGARAFTALIDFRNQKCPADKLHFCRKAWTKTEEIRRAEGRDSMPFLSAFLHIHCRRERKQRHTVFTGTQQQQQQQQQSRSDRERSCPC